MFRCYKQPVHMTLKKALAINRYWWDTPPGVGLETPQADPPTSPPGVGLETPHQTPQPPSRYGLGDPPAPPPTWTEFLTHASENITLPQLRCGW